MLLNKFANIVGITAMPHADAGKTFAYVHKEHGEVHITVRGVTDKLEIVFTASGQQMVLEGASPTPDVQVVCVLSNKAGVQCAPMKAGSMDDLVEKAKMAGQPDEMLAFIRLLGDPAEFLATYRFVGAARLKVKFEDKLPRTYGGDSEWEDMLEQRRGVFA